MARPRKRVQKDGYRLVADPGALTAAERDEIPPVLLARFTTWWNVRCGRGSLPVPSCFAWAEESIRVRYPVLERVEMTEDVFRWEVRLRHDRELSRPRWPCLGFREGPPTEDLPAPLAWLASTFGTCTLEPYASGSASWGQRLGSLLDGENGLLLENDIAEGLVLPPRCLDWVVLYEADGDAVCADLQTGKTYWTGGETFGEPFTDLEVDCMAAIQFILWRLLDDHKVHGVDLRMMSAATAPPDAASRRR